MPSLRVNDGPLKVRSSTGDISTIAAGSGRPSSRACIAVTSARLPPTESPANTTRAGSKPVDSIQFQAAKQSSVAAGNGCSGASR